MSNNLQKNILKQVRDKTGTSITNFAKHQKVSRKCIYDAVTGGGVRRVRIAIAQTLELPPSVIWPGNHAHTRIIDDLHYLKLHI